MRIVERLADWGWRPLPKGKLVWARMRTADPVEPADPGGEDDGTEDRDPPRSEGPREG